MVLEVEDNVEANCDVVASDEVEASEHKSVGG